MNEQAIMELGKFVDLHGLRSTLAMLANVCAEKIEHVHDVESANNWNRAYKIILKAHAELPL